MIKMWYDLIDQDGEVLLTNNFGWFETEQQYDQWIRSWDSCPLGVDITRCIVEHEPLPAKDENGNDVYDLAHLIELAKLHQFGDSGGETLVDFLSCTAFEHRFDPNSAKAFRLAALIISRVIEI